MPKRGSETPPLSLSQVLKDEYEKLHGAARLNYPDGASEDERLSTIYSLIHSLNPKRTALCISGGGIRSATFALGIVQGLARCGVLDKFDYLSTVSGGGYIGSWLTAWTHRQGMQQVITELTSDRSPLAPEPAPVSRLREYCNYLSPKLGLLSADTWTLLATVLRNLLLNWFVLIPLLAAALMIPRVGIPVLQMNPGPQISVLCLVLGCVSLGWAIGYVGLHRPTTELLRGDQGGFLRWCLVPLTLASILLITYWAWAGHRIVWSKALGFSLGERNFEIRQDLLIFVALGIGINFIAFLGGTLVRFRRIRLTALWEAIAVIFTGALGGCLVWCGATVVFPEPLKSPTTLLLYVCLSSPIFLTALLVTESVFVGLSSYWTSDHDREWWSRSGAWILIYIVVWSAASALLIFGPMGLLRLEADLRAFVVSVGGISGFITILFGRSARTSSQEESEPKQKGLGGMKSSLMRYALSNG